MIFRKDGWKGGTLDVKVLKVLIPMKRLSHSVAVVRQLTQNLTKR